MKKIIYSIFTFLLFFAVTFTVEAGGSLSTSASSVKVGDSFTATVNLTGVASWHVRVSASGPVSGCTIDDSNVTEDANNGSKSYSTTCKATGVGTITINLNGDYAKSEDEHATPLSATKTVTVTNASSSSSSGKTTGSSNKTTSSQKNTTENDKSSNVFLKSLSVEGQALTPEFKKDVLEYNLTISSDVKKIKINAEAEDSKSKISGIGEQALNEKENSFKVVVTAENGETNTYTINVKVDDEAIIVTVDGKKYTVVKNKEELPELKLKHEDLILQIQEQPVPAYRIDKLNYVLVGLKDSKGKIRLYKFDSYKNNKKPARYTLFREFSSKELHVTYLEFPKSFVPKYYKKYKEVINGDKVTVYKLKKNSRYSLFYGTNIETGKDNIYKYDNKEKTIQAYDKSETKFLNKRINEYELCIIGLISFSAFVLMILVIVVAVNKKRQKNLLNSYNAKLNEISKKQNTI